jgi:hypothetical protein
MFSKRRYLGALFLIGLTALGEAAEFAPPAEGPVAFRRDRIPLDADAISGLSKNLETLARGTNTVTAAERRCAAQILALSLALDPSNSKARGLIREFQSGDRNPDADPVLLEKSRARIWQLSGWLESPEAGSQGQALAACLKDVIALSDPRNPKSAAIREAGEKGAWTGWIPALSAYESSSIASNQGTGDTPDPLTPQPPSTGGSPIKLNKAQIYTLVWNTAEKTETPVWKLGVGKLEMTAETSAESGDTSDPAARQPLVVRFGHDVENNPLNPIANTVRNLMRKRHAAKTGGVTITFDSPDLRASIQANKRLSISAAAAVLADSAFTGAEPDAVVLGSVDESGAFKLPTSFWDQIRALPKGSGQRLILPADASTYLPSMLALERPEFFIEYEVILAADFTQLIALCAKKPEGPPGVAITEFRTIRERLGAQDVRQYISNIYVKQRLTSVLQELPSDFSAKMLLVQAAGNRPTTVARPVLATEIRRALEPLAGLLKNQNEELDASDISKLSQVFESCRAALSQLERYAAKNDAPLLIEATDLVNLVRNLEKATRTRGEDYVVKTAVTTARADLARSAKQFADKLAAEIGEPVPTPSR